MSDMITILEKVDRDVRLRHVSGDEKQLSLASTWVDQEICGAIVNRDGVQLGNLMGVNVHVFLR